MEKSIALIEPTNGFIRAEIALGTDCPVEHPVFDDNRFESECRP
jgi:hypothetical protein